MALYQYPNYLCHHGIKGMKWGRRNKNNGVTFKRAHKMALDAEGKSWSKSRLAYRSLKASRRQQKASDKYAAKASATKNTKKALKYQYKSTKYKNASEANKNLTNQYNKIGSTVIKYRSNQSYGKSVVKSLLMSKSGRFEYDFARSQNASRGRAIVSAFAKNSMEIITPKGSLFGAGIQLNSDDYKKAHTNSDYELRQKQKKAKAQYKQAKKDLKNR